MKVIKKIYVIFLALFFTSYAFAINAPCSAGTADTLPKGYFEIGLFQPLRYGQTETLEWSTHPILDLLIPNITIKKAWRDFAGWDFATRHNITYPTPLLRTISRKGTGGIISPEFDIPQMFSLRNEVLLTRKFSPSFLITGKAGLTLAVTSDELDERTTIDLPLVFPRLGVFYNGYAVNFGLDVGGDLTSRFAYLTDVDIFLLPGADENFAFEHKSLIIWNKSKKFQMMLGYKLVFGEYPFGKQWHLLPLFDMQWARQFRN